MRNSERTRQHYEKTARLYFDRPDDALRTKSKATYYARKAALIFVAAQRMVVAIKASDFLNAFKSARVLRRFFTYTDGPTALAAGSVCPINAKPKLGKRKSLRGLPVDWRAQLVPKTIRVGILGKRKSASTSIHPDRVTPQHCKTGQTADDCEHMTNEDVAYNINCGIDMTNAHRQLVKADLATNLAIRNILAIFWQRKQQT